MYTLKVFTSLKIVSHVQSVEFHGSAVCAVENNREELYFEDISCCH